MVTRHGVRLERVVIERDYVFGGMDMMFFSLFFLRCKSLGKAASALVYLPLHSLSFSFSFSHPLDQWGAKEEGVPSSS